MEKAPFQPELENPATMAAPAASTPTSSDALRVGVVTSEWRKALPVMTGRLVTLREVRKEDAPTLLAMLSTEEVSRFITPPPTTVEGFEQFIAWAIAERECGRFACYGVVPAGMTQAIGIFQVRSIDSSMMTADWGFAIGSAFWGTGVFLDSAKMVLQFAFESAGVHRLEARAAIGNGRGNGALRKIGAVQEGVLRRSFFRNGECHDQVLWAIIVDDWRVQRRGFRVMVH